jgi:hypothetical protein
MFNERVMALHDPIQDRIRTVASPIHACQCSIGSWLVMMVALFAARSSMISSRSEQPRMVLLNAQDVIGLANASAVPFAAMRCSVRSNAAVSG